MKTVRTGYAKRLSRVGALFVLPAAVGFSVFYLIPFAISFFFSVTRGVGRNLQFVVLDNYIRLFRNVNFWQGFWNSFRFILVALPLLMVLSLLCALALRNLSRCRGALRMALLIPLVIPTASVVFYWQSFFGDTGPVNWLLSVLGLPAVEFFGEKGAFGMLVALFIWKYLGYCTLLFFAGVNSIPGLYYEAAMLDGAGAVRRFFSVTLPYLVPTVIFVSVISVANSFKIYREAYLLFGERPPDSVYMLSHFMQNSFTYMDFAKLSASAISLLAIFGVVIFSMIRFSKSFGGVQQ